MKTIKTSTVVTNFKGEPMKVQDKELTVGQVLSNILGGKVSNPHLGWQLGKKFATEDEVSLKAEDIVFIKKELQANSQLNEGAYYAIVIGFIVDLLESEDKPKK